MMQLEQLVGVWSLVTCYMETESGQRSFYFGEDAIGRLVYEANGRMYVFVQNPARPRLADDTGQWTPDELKAAFKGFDAYYGRYSFDAETGIVTHHVEMARLPNYVDTDQVRHVALQDGILKFSTTPSQVAGEEVVFYLDWRKEDE